MNSTDVPAQHTDVEGFKSARIDPARCTNTSMDTQDDEHLLSILGVTTANPEDIERDVIAAAEESMRRRKKGRAADEQEENESQSEDEQDEASCHEALLINRLNVLNQEINAVAAGLESLEQEDGDDASKDADEANDEEDEREGNRIKNLHGDEQFQLQRVLAEERLASLQAKRTRLLEKLATLQAGLLDVSEEDKDKDSDADTASAKARAQKGKSVIFVDSKLKGAYSDGVDDALDSSSSFVETERDRLIRTGMVTPFDRLKGFERRVERSTGNDLNHSRAESSIANAAASIAAIARTRPTTKLLDASELPKLAPSTREFRRIRKLRRHADSEAKTGKGLTKKLGLKRRPLPEGKWRKRERAEHAGKVTSDDDYLVVSSRETTDGEEIETKTRKRRKKVRKAGGEGSGFEEGVEEDVLLEGGLRLPASIYNNLFDYQRTGVKWLWELHCQKAGGIIADEMGLGKTIQVIGFLASLHYSGLYKPSIIVCPVTLLRQWKREAQKWYEPFEVEILHDSAVSHSKRSAKSRKKKVKSDSSSNADEDDEEEDDEESEEEKTKDVKLASKKHSNRWDALIKKIVNSQSGLLVTTYEQLRILREKLLNHEWGYAVLDEGHRIRNPDAEVTLVCKQLQTVHRIIMTGAPIQNRLTELWSLFDFVFPGKLGVLPVFQAQFSLPIAIGGYTNATPLQVSTAYKCAVVLRDLIMPYLLRRLKSDVNARLTKKTEHVLFCSLSEEQRSAYRAFLASSEVEQIFDGNRNSLYGIDILRKICNHADLLEREQSSSHPDYGNPERSGKLKVLAQVLDSWKSQGHRVLIFSQTQQMLDIIESYVIGKGFTYRRMDGSTPIRQRMALIDEFNESSHVFVFLLTTKVGGLGTNLIGANKVVIFDPDWNPSTDMQARERAWRIGQTRDVTIYRLITRGTIEEKVYHRQIYKHFLTNKILKDPQQRRVFKAKDLRDLFTLNEEKHEMKTETSALFAELSNVEVSNGNEQSQAMEFLKAGSAREDNSGLKQGSGLGKAFLELDESPEDDSHILKCLFEANGIHSALNHEAIESMNDLEKMKVDNESARVAQQAAAAVMQSRLQRRTDNVAVPTWTGRSGAAGAPMAVRRRFGSTTNSRFASPSPSGMGNMNQAGTLASGVNRPEALMAGVAGSSNGRALSSTDILARIRGRVGSGVGIAGSTFHSASNALIGGFGDGSSTSVQRSEEPRSLADQLHSFIERQGGSVSSTTIVARFKDIVPNNNTAYFRQVLKEVATLRKEGAEGRWVLKAGIADGNA